MKYFCLLFSVLLLMFTVGCSSDNDSSDGTTSETASETTSETTAAGDEDDIWGDDTGYRTLGDHELEIDFD